MYLTIHAAAGALVGHYIDQPAISFTLGLISHYFLDMLPHFDGNIPTKTKTAKQLKKRYLDKIIALVYLDISLAIIVFTAIFTNNVHFLTPAAFWGILGSILPDIFQALSFFNKKNRFLKSANNFHNLLHYSPQQNISKFMCQANQFAMLIILVKPLIPGI
jgi:hypothetical protein